MNMSVNKGRDLDFIPPTRDNLILHAKQAVYQAGHVWRTCFTAEPSLPSPTEWDWELKDGVYQPLWTVAYSQTLLMRVWNCHTVGAWMNAWMTVFVMKPITMQTADEQLH